MDTILYVYRRSTYGLLSYTRIFQSLEHSYDFFYMKIF